MTMLRTLFLSIHVAGGGVGLLLGALAMRPPDTTKSRLPIRLAYAAAVLILVVFLYATLAADWGRLALTQRVAFGVLAGLAAFILIRLYLAFEIAGSGRRTGKRATSTTFTSPTSRSGKASSSLA